MDSVHAQKLDGLVDGWREVEAATNAELAALGTGTAGGGDHGRARPGPGPPATVRTRTTATSWRRSPTR